MYIYVYVYLGINGIYKYTKVFKVFNYSLKICILNIQCIYHIKFNILINRNNS